VIDCEGKSDCDAIYITTISPDVFNFKEQDKIDKLEGLYLKANANNEKGEEIDVVKMISGNIRSKRKMMGEKATVKFSNKLFQMENKLNLAEQPRPNRKPLFKRANTINKMNNIFHFKGSELKFKDN
jgi:hypothetical protein